MGQLHINNRCYDVDDDVACELIHALPVAVHQLGLIELIIQEQNGLVSILLSTSTPLFMTADVDISLTTSFVEDMLREIDALGSFTVTGRFIK